MQTIGSCRAEVRVPTLDLVLRTPHGGHLERPHGILAGAHQSSRREREPQVRDRWTERAHADVTPAWRKLLRRTPTNDVPPAVAAAGLPRPVDTDSDRTVSHRMCVNGALVKT